MKPLVIPGREPSENALPARALCFAGAFVMSDVMSENVAKLIAILATFSRTGHNQADVDCGGKVDLPALTDTGQYHLDGTFTDWQSGGSRVRVPSPPLAGQMQLERI
jgi:hypothetical protein